MEFAEVPMCQFVSTLMGKFVLQREILKPHSTRVASNSAAYKLGMLLQEVLKRGKW